MKLIPTFVGKTEENINSYINSIIKESIIEDILYYINNNYIIPDNILEDSIKYDINIEDYIGGI